MCPDNQRIHGKILNQHSGTFTLVFTNFSFSNVELPLQPTEPTTPLAAMACSWSPLTLSPTTDLMRHVPPPCLFLLQTLGSTSHWFHSHSLMDMLFYEKCFSCLISMGMLTFCFLLVNHKCSITEQRILAFFAR